MDKLKSRGKKILIHGDSPQKVKPFIEAHKKRKTTLIIPNPLAMKSGDKIPLVALPKFTDEEQKAYEWALPQTYVSGAARYAKVLAKYIEKIKG